MANFPRLNRRELLQVGYSGLLGIGLPAFCGQAHCTPARSGRKTKSVILVFLTGAPSHLDTFDPKPDAPLEIRGAFKPIATNVPGIQICEHLPRLAGLADRYAIVRSMTHSVPVHEIGTHFLLTGINALPPGANHMATRHDWPCFAAGLNYLQPRADGIPNGVMLPTYLHNGYGFSGQNGGVLGARHDPWQIRQDPNAENFRGLGNSTPAIGLTVDRLRERRSLLANLDQQRRALAGKGESSQLTFQQKQAFHLIESNRTARAFDLSREPETVRERYGRHMFGQSLLLARRLIEAGVPIVQANMGSMNQWDTHNNGFNALKNNLLPFLDRGMSALLDDLRDRGLEDETLVVMVGEFGRTPKVGQDNGGNITNRTGRDHWAGCFFAVLAGGGVRGGQVLGRSDRKAAYPAMNPFSPADLGATVYTALGVNPKTEVIDRQGRPLQLNSGKVMQALYTV
jgi:uncharacterized protein (DUF1501 family)